MDIQVPGIAITEKVIRSAGVYRFPADRLPLGNDSPLGGGLVGAFVIIALDWKEGITTMSEVRYAILEEGGHASVIARRSVPA